ncbi:hypothetical protein B0H16DRAFT_1468651 [Mycena metata]|uniref:Uncharacterized protein n=1 Tax=Mycena metata TaxID=1033252 RepID=A0AAD7I1X2_9AGAR|nr:hypothetical protein B0H16DRAFT_1468651 [Mycena metata]
MHRHQPKINGVPPRQRLLTNGEAAGGAKLLGPLLVDLGLEVERAAFVVYVARNDEQAEGSVDREEGAVVQQKGDGERAECELGGDGDEEDAGVLECVEVGEEGEDECEEGVAGDDGVGDEEDDLEARPAGFVI